MARVGSETVTTFLRAATNLLESLGDIINSWRKSMDLEPVPATEGPLLTDTLKVPHTYCWSPALVPRPTDWPAHIGEL